MLASPAVSVNGAEQLSNLGWVGDGGMIARNHGSQRAAQIGGGIAIRTTGGDGVTEHSAALGANPVRRFVLAASFDPAQRPEQIRCLDVDHRPLADIRKDECLKALALFL